MAATRDLDRRGLAALASGHAAADLCQGAVPALIPFLIAQRGYSFGAAGALLLVVTVGSSIIQPLFGAVSDRLVALVADAGRRRARGGRDRRRRAWRRASRSPRVAVGIGGLGVAAFHPEGARYANYASGARRGTGHEPLLASAATPASRSAPILITPAVLVFGLSGTLRRRDPARDRRRRARVRAAAPARAQRRRGRGAAAARAPTARRTTGARSARLTGVVSVRSGIYFGLQSFAPVWLIHEYGASEATGNAALAAMLVAGAIGTLVGGRLVDRIGRRKVLVGSIVAPDPAAAGVHARAERHRSPACCWPAIGFVTVMSFSVSVVMGQEYLPSRLGIASGVTLGLAIGIGGVAAALLGVLADHAGPGDRDVDDRAAARSPASRSR